MEPFVGERLRLTRTSLTTSVGEDPRWHTAPCSPSGVQIRAASVCTPRAGAGFPNPPGPKARNDCDAEDTLDTRRGRAAVDLIAAGKSWALISGILKRSMKSVELHAKTRRLVGAKKERGLTEMRKRDELQAMEETGAALQANAHNLPLEQPATNYFGISGDFVRR